MYQMDLEKKYSKICPNCKKKLKADIIADDHIIYWCSDCMKEYRYSICQNCYCLFEDNNFIHCDSCRKEIIKFLEKPIVL